MISTRFEEYRRINDELPFVLHARLKRTAESLSRESNWHGELEIQLCLDGEGTVLLDGCAINIKKGRYNYHKLQRDTLYVNGKPS